TGLHQRLFQDTKSLFPLDCNRTTRQDGWFDPDKGHNSGMVHRAEDTTCSGYDFYNSFLTGLGN
nr:hypothetical protein [Tanacetum cinerariifolium]